MRHLLNRVRVYSLYFYEYLRYAEFKSVIHAVMYMLTRKSYSEGETLKSRMGTFETRRGTLDFQYINYAYEIGLKDFIKKQTFDVFFDVGACLGEYCIWLGRSGYRCFAFEPVSDSFDMIKKNIALNNVQTNVTAFNYGLGSKHSTEYFLLHRTNPGANKRVQQPGKQTQKFEICAIDDVYQDWGLSKDTKILMKIDIEGMEAEMLKGAKKFLQAFSNITLILEEKISGKSAIINALDGIGKFEYGQVDDLNIYAKKIGPATIA